MNLLRLALVLAALTPGLSAQTPPVAPASEPNAAHPLPRSGDFVFNLLPKAFQRHPSLEMTVNTEVTAVGRLARPVSPSAPVYYVAQSAGFKPLGTPTGGEKSPPPAALERAMTQALAANGYLPSTQPAQRPTLVVIYYWGSHNKLDRDTAEQFPELAAKHDLERATLVGGKKYAAQLARRQEWGDSLVDHTALKDYVHDQSTDDLYFVVASAYDYAAAARNERRVIWRTTMTVNARGVSMTESLAPLIATAAPFFGVETPEPAIASRNISRDGRVEIGTPTVVPESAAKK